MRARFLLSLGVVMSLQAQESPDLLQTARQRVADTLDRLPRYMCTQTITRFQTQPSKELDGNHCDSPPGTHLTTWDRLRLNVAMTSHGEMYSWVGSRLFGDNDLFKMVRDGAISSGGFANLLKAIFRGDGASVTPGVPQGHSQMEFSFRVPKDKSDYHAGDRDHFYVTGYDGSFLIDRKTGDLTQLIIHTDRLPPDTGSCSFTTTLNYNRIRMKDDAFLLPTDSRMVTLAVNGSKSENRTVFSGCHEFIGESTVSFEPSSDASSDPPPPAAIPAGLLFGVVLTEQIDMETAAAGDSVTGKLATPIRDSTHVLVPAGAMVRARLVRLREFHGRIRAISLAFKIQSVVVNGVEVRLDATPDFDKNIPNKSRVHMPVALGPLSALEERAVTFTFEGNYAQPKIPKALRSNWVTTYPP